KLSFLGARSRYKACTGRSKGIQRPRGEAREADEGRPTDAASATVNAARGIARHTGSGDYDDGDQAYGQRSRRRDAYSARDDRGADERASFVLDLRFFGHEGFHRRRNSRQPGRESFTDLLRADERGAQERAPRRERSADH